MGLQGLALSRLLPPSPQVPGPLHCCSFSDSLQALPSAPSHAESLESPLLGKGNGLQELKQSGVWDQTLASVQGMEPFVWRVGYRILGLLASAVEWGEQPNPNFGVGGWVSLGMFGHL